MKKLKKKFKNIDKFTEIFSKVVNLLITKLFFNIYIFKIIILKYN